MWTAVLQLMLLLFAITGYAGAGTAFAAVRSRYVMTGERDAGMIAVGAMLFVFGSICAAVEWGLLGVCAVGAVATWVGYVVGAQRLGVFRIETGFLAETCAEETRHTS